MATTKNLEQAAVEALQSLGESCQECRESCEEKIREAPLAAVACAAGAGFLFHILPVGTIVASLLRIALFLLRPALLVFGAMKFYEMLQAPPPLRRKEDSADEPLVDSPQGPAKKRKG